MINILKVPIAGALFVATCLGTPVIALTGDRKAEYGRCKKIK